MMHRSKPIVVWSLVFLMAGSQLGVTVAEEEKKPSAKKPPSKAGASIAAAAKKQSEQEEDEAKKKNPFAESEADEPAKTDETPADEPEQEPGRAVIADPKTPQDLGPEPVPVETAPKKLPAFGPQQKKPNLLEQMLRPEADKTPQPLGDIDAEPLTEPQQDLLPDDSVEPFPGEAEPETVDKHRPSDELAEQIKATLNWYYNKRLNTRDNSHWDIMHRIVCWGVDAEVHQGHPRGQLVNAIGWLCWNGRAKGERFLYHDRYGLQVRKAHNQQGHYGQFLAMLAQAEVSPDYEIRVDGRKYTIRDLIGSEMKGCQTGMDLTFKLIGFSYYLSDTDAAWTNHRGEEWNMERMIRQEIAAPILREAPCGGTHRLMSLAYAVRARILDGKPIDGEFKRAQTYLDDYHQYTLALQNGDGSFSTEWFRRRAARQDVDRRLQTTGHILEWLVFSLSDDQLQDPQITRAVEYLNELLWSYRGREWEIGPLGHALHALILYHDRVYGHEAQEGLRPDREAQTTSHNAFAE